MIVHNKTKFRKAVMTEDGYVVLKGGEKRKFNEVRNKDALVKSGVDVTGEPAIKPKAKEKVTLKPKAENV